MGFGPSNTLVNEWLREKFVLNTIWLQLHDGDPGTNGASNIVDADRQLVLFGEPSPDGYIESVGAPPAFTIGEDTTIRYGSLHTEFEGGLWRWNLIARQPLTVVEGDVLLLGEGIDLRITGWTS